ncbi:glucose-6-phosphate isomerase [bacterium]|nr:glucose-6-phosphate isomerase [bacterium]
MLQKQGITLDTSRAETFLAEGAVDGLAAEVARVAAELESGRGPGSDYLGWVDLPGRIAAADLAAFRASGEKARDSEVYVVVGIGGSYLGARAVLEALGGRAAGAPEIVFAGTGLCSATLRRALDRVRDRDFRVCVISKSGTTLEPAVAFRIFRAELEHRYGRTGAATRITAVTDRARGALRGLADEQGYETFVIPDDVGGRFSVLTPVGLVPLAAAGLDIDALVAGAAAMSADCTGGGLRENPAHLYAAVRHLLYGTGFTTEVLSTFHGDLQMVQEWWKQLFGESEGKGGQGIFPASTVFTTDLHSLGQYVQDGRRDLQETFLCVRHAVGDVSVPHDAADLDGLNDLAGRPLDEINWHAYEGTRQAHLEGGVPCTSLELDRLTPHGVGALLYMFEKAVGVSGRLLGVNPFDQPGVETYKKEMFRRLGRA